MQNVQDLMIDVMANGIEKEDRTGVGSKAVFGRILRWNLQDGFPAQTVRRVPFRIAFEETMFFLRGESQTKLLEEKNVNIWKGNTSREFLDKRGLNYLQEGDMGRSYGVQWRDWQTVGEDTNGSYEKSTDQIADLLKNLKEDPFSRRHVVTGWNPGELDQMALPPCHMMHMYSIEKAEFDTSNGKLNTCFVMRSNDVPFGLPFNIMSYALMNQLFAKYLNMEQGDLVYFGWDVHIYKNQYAMVEEMFEREPKALPILKIHKDLKTFDDILNVQFSDIELIGYDPHPDVKNKPGMAI